MPPSAEGVVHRYLSRLGIAPRPAPDLATLRLIHQRHLDRIPYENLAILVGEPPSTDPLASLTRIAATGRAGYCFHHNGALEVVLRTLGYDVSRRFGYVGDEPEPTLNHLILVVALPEGDHWVDVGLGDGPRSPLPLVEGRHEQDGFVFTLTRTLDGWSLQHDPTGSFRRCLLIERGVTDAQVAAAHAALSTPPDGRFTRLLVVQRRHAAGTDILRNHHRITVTPGSTVQETLDYPAWRDTLLDLGLPDPGEAVYAWMRGAEEAWRTAQE